jgi:N-acetyl-1-D-myo-inositol-2-amino-2-deoxy-alpha-D-glucopyranoside deacetylase
MGTERMLVVVAHPDDETFGCGSLIAHATARGVPTTVVCATRGEAGTPAPGSAVEPGELAVVREAELRRAAALLGAQRVEVLSWRDSGMDGPADASTLVGADPAEVAAAVASVIDELRPTVVVTLDGSDGHRDHVRIRDVTLRAVDNAGWQSDRVYLYCLPRRLMRRWVDELQRREPDSNYLALGELGTPDEDITTVVDTGELYDLREQAIAIHASQTSPYEIMGPEFRRAFLTTETLRRVRPVAAPGTAETELFGAQVVSGST